MERTCWLVVFDFKAGTQTVPGKITCRSVGQMADGSMVWEDEAGEQYQLFRTSGVFWFTHL